MKKLTLLLIVFFGMHMSYAQTETEDSVTLGRGYVSQVFYNLKDGAVKSDSNVTWDLSFDVTSRGGTIRTNGAFGVKLYNYPLGDTAAWDRVDTAQLSSWIPQYNSDKSWEIGAFNNHVLSGEFDLGWGVYDINTHIVTGDSVYVVEFDDKSLKKLVIEKLRGGRYFVRYANIDGSEDTTVVVDKFDYENKNTGYYSIRKKMQMDREPLASTWDLSFHRYMTKLPGNVDYPVVGVLANFGVTISEARNVNLDSVKYNTFPYDTANINTIGHDWKSFDLGCSCYSIEDSLAYYVKDNNGMIYRIIFTGFTGTESGIIKFTKEWIDTTVGLVDGKKNESFFGIYPNPNPNSSNKVEIVYDLNQADYSEEITLNVHDINGRLVLDKKLRSNNGLNSYYFNTTEFQKGIYMVSFSFNEKRVYKKLIVQ